MKIFLSNKTIKERLGQEAASLILDGMKVGLGSGSTASCFIKSLGERCKKGLKIEAVASSKASEMLAKEVGIPLLDLKNLTVLDITVDGADEIDSKKRMIKGGGGALLREKILASISHEMVVIVDESKRVKRLGKMPLPVEVIPFAHHAIQEEIKKLGLKSKWRTDPQGKIYITDNQNYILDVEIENQFQIAKKLKTIPGVVETGLFISLAGRVLIGKSSGEIEILQ